MTGKQNEDGFFKNSVSVFFFLFVVVVCLLILIFAMYINNIFSIFI